MQNEREDLLPVKIHTFFLRIYLLIGWGVPIFILILMCMICEPQREKRNKIDFAPCENSDWPGHPPSLIIFAVSMKVA